MLSAEDKDFCKKCRYASEIAEYLGISTDTLRRWLSLLREEKQLQATRRKYYLPKEVECILENMK